MELLAQHALSGEGQEVCSIQNLIQSGALPSKRVSFSTNEVIFQPDDPADRCFLIESGEVRLYHDVNPNVSRMIDILGPDDLIGVAALGGLPTFGKRAVAVTPTTVYSLAISVLRAEFLRNPASAVSIIHAMAIRLHQAWNAGSEQIHHDCNTRIIHAMLRFGNSPAATRGAEGTVLHMTHAQLAQAVGTARETVTICITNLKKRNILRTGRSRLVFDPIRLAAAAPF